MITQALFDYLTDASDLTGHPAERFRSDVTVGEHTLRNRNDARAVIRAAVGRSIYLGRRPEASPSPTAVSLRTVTEIPDVALSGGRPASMTLLQVDTWTRGPMSAKRGHRVARLLQVATHGYHGANWGDVWIGEATVERASLQVIPPGDGSDDWTHQHSFDLMVHHVIAAAEYPSRTLTAQVEFLTGYDAGDYLKLSAASTIIPENRELTSLSWYVSCTNGNLTVSDVAPHEGLDESTHRGTGLQLEVLRGITFIGVPITAQVTVTDDTGETDQTEETQSG